MMTELSPCRNSADGNLMVDLCLCSRVIPPSSFEKGNLICGLLVVSVKNKGTASNMISASGLPTQRSSTSLLFGCNNEIDKSHTTLQGLSACLLAPLFGAACRHAARG